MPKASVTPVALQIHVSKRGPCRKCRGVPSAVPLKNPPQKGKKIPSTSIQQRTLRALDGSNGPKAEAWRFGNLFVKPDQKSPFQRKARRKWLNPPFKHVQTTGGPNPGITFQLASSSQVVDWPVNKDGRIGPGPGIDEGKGHSHCHK